MQVDFLRPAVLMMLQAGFRSVLPVAIEAVKEAGDNSQSAAQQQL